MWVCRYCIPSYTQTVRACVIVTTAATTSSMVMVSCIAKECGWRRGKTMGVKNGSNCTRPLSMGRNVTAIAQPRSCDLLLYNLFEGSTASMSACVTANYDVWHLRFYARTIILLLTPLALMRLTFMVLAIVGDVEPDISVISTAFRAPCPCLTVPRGSCGCPSGRLRCLARPCRSSRPSAASRSAMISFSRLRTHRHT